MVGHGGSSAGLYLADPTSPIPSHCASIVATSTLRVKYNMLIPYTPKQSKLKYLRPPSYWWRLSQITLYSRKHLTGTLAHNYHPLKFNFPINLLCVYMNKILWGSIDFTGKDQSSWLFTVTQCSSITDCKQALLCVCFLQVLFGHSVVHIIQCFLNLLIE